MASEKTQNKSQRIALIASEFTISHYSIFLRHLLVGLADESIHVALVCPEKCKIDSIILGSVEIIRYPVFELPFAGYFNKKLLLDRIIKFKPTFLHCLCESQASVTKYLALRLDLPYVLTINSLHKRFRKISISQNHCHKIIVPTTSIANDITKKYSHLSDIIEQIKYGSFTKDTTSCFAGHSRNITMILAYSAQKYEEIENVLSSIRHMKIDGYEFIIFLINVGDMHPNVSCFTKCINIGSERRAEKKIWKMLNAFGLIQSVTIIPRQIPWRVVLETGDIFIYPMSSYSFNSILIEAMSVGTAVAACKGGVDDLIIEDQTAIILKHEDDLSIMRTLQRFLERPEYARKIAKNAQKYIKENHSVSKYIEEILKIYNKIDI